MVGQANQAADALCRWDTSDSFANKAAKLMQDKVEIKVDAYICSKFAPGTFSAIQGGGTRFWSDPNGYMPVRVLQMWSSGN